MKTFKQHLTEVVRDEKRATKLGVYLAKRHGGVIKNKDYDEKAGDIAYGSAYKDSRDKGHNLQNRFHNTETTKVQIDSLKLTQAHTIFNKSGAKKKFKDTEPVSVVHHNGTHYLVNGHHRYIAHKLLGKKHIDAKVLSLDEVARSPERATKLGKYLVDRANRQRLKDGHNTTSNKFDLPAYHKNTFAHNYEDDHDDKAFGNAYTNAYSVFRKRKKNIQDVSVKDVLKHNSQPITFDHEHKGSNYKMHDKKPINIARSRKTGNLEVIDGYHRLAAHWLQGKETIKANLQDVGYGKRKKKE